jgi:hypothetical protein
MLVSSDSNSPPMLAGWGLPLDLRFDGDGAARPGLLAGDFGSIGLGRGLVLDEPPVSSVNGANSRSSSEFLAGGGFGEPGRDFSGGGDAADPDGRD